MYFSVVGTCSPRAFSGFFSVEKKLVEGSWFVLLWSLSFAGHFGQSLLLLIWLLKNSMHVLTGCTVAVAYSLGYALSCTVIVLGMYCSLVVVWSCLTFTVVLVTHKIVLLESFFFIDLVYVHLCCSINTASLMLLCCIPLVVFSPFSCSHVYYSLWAWRAPGLVVSLLSLLLVNGVGLVIGISSRLISGWYLAVRSIEANGVGLVM